MADYAEACSQGHQESALPPAFLDRARDTTARLIGASADEVSFTGSTSHSLSLIAAGLPVVSGDNLVIYGDDYPSNVYPWLALRRHGVEVRKITARSLGEIDPDDVLAHVDERTRLVALSSVHYLSGWRIDVETIGKELRQRNVWFCLDAIQSLGAFPTKVRQVDVLAAGGHKWLLGPCGSGMLYVRKAVREQLRPIMLGWHNVACPDFVVGEELFFPDGPQRFEPGTQNWIGLVGLAAALQLLSKAGVDNVAANLRRKRSRLVERLQNKGYAVLSADAPDENTSGIVSFHHPTMKMSVAHECLAAHRVAASLRNTRVGQQILRLSPHFYVTESELEDVVALV
jgi:selenocysteine lyase/cysteine desulfurase